MFTKMAPLFTFANNYIRLGGKAMKINIKFSLSLESNNESNVADNKNNKRKPHPNPDNNSPRISDYATEKFAQLPASPSNIKLLTAPPADNNAKKEEGEALTEEFITKLNKSPGVLDLKKNLEKARQFLQHERKCVGLDSPKGIETKNVPSSRKTFLLLSTIDDALGKDIKMEALEALIELLKFDPLENDSASGLVPLATDLMKNLNRDLAQTSPIDIQIKTATAFGITIQLILDHYQHRHLNAVADPLKKQLLEVANSLKALNAQNDPELIFAVEFALEGIMRLTSDDSALVRTIEGIKSILDGLREAYKRNISGAVTNFGMVVKEINNKIISPWYSRADFLDNVAELIQKQNHDYFDDLEKIFKDFTEPKDNIEKIIKSTWMLTYSYINTLAKLALRAKSEEIRREAYFQIKLFSKCEKFSKDFHLKQSFKRMEIPKPTNINLVIERHAMNQIITIANFAPEKEIRTNARKFLEDRFSFEEKYRDLLSEPKKEERRKTSSSFSKKEINPSKEIIETKKFIDKLKEVIPSNPQELEDWREEKNKFAFQQIDEEKEQSITEEDEWSELSPILYEQDNNRRDEEKEQSIAAEDEWSELSPILYEQDNNRRMEILGLTMLKGHSNIVHAIIELRSGKIASCSEDKTIRIWNRLGKCLNIFQESLPVTALIESNEDLLVSGSTDGTVKIWDLFNKCKKTFQAHEGSINVLIKLLDGTIASGSEDKTIKVWNQHGECFNTLVPFHSSTEYKPISILLELSGGKLASVPRGSSNVSLWNRMESKDPSSKKYLKVIKGHTKSISSFIELSVNTFASGSFFPNKDIEIRNFKGNLLKTLNGHDDSISCFARLNMKTFASSSCDKTIKIWKNEGKYIKTLEDYLNGYTARCLTTFEDGSLASGTYDGAIRVLSPSFLD